MNTAYLFPGLLTLHVTALIIMAGTTLVDYITYQTFWKLFDQEKERSQGVLQVLAKFSRILGIGAAILVLTGIGMMVLTQGIFGEQLWFRIKFVLVLLLITNSLLVGRRQGVKLSKLVHEKGPDFMKEISRIRITLGRFHVVQLGLFFTIIFLSVFKFN